MLPSKPSEKIFFGWPLLHVPLKSIFPERVLTSKLWSVLPKKVFFLSVVKLPFFLHAFTLTLLMLRLCLFSVIFLMLISYNLMCCYWIFQIILLVDLNIILHLTHPVLNFYIALEIPFCMIK